MALKNNINFFKNKTVFHYSDKRFTYRYVSLDYKHSAGIKSFVSTKDLPFHFRNYFSANKFLLIRDYPNLKSYTDVNKPFPINYTGIVIDDTLQTTGDLIHAISYPFGFRTLFGKSFSNYTSLNYIKVDTNNKKFIVCSQNQELLVEDIYYGLPPTIYRTKTYDSTFFFHISNVLFVKMFAPYYETIQYPMLFTVYFYRLFTDFELQDKNQTKTTIYMKLTDGYSNCFDDKTYWSITIDRYKLAFSKDLTTWYKYDFSVNDFVEIENYSYQTHLTDGNTFSEYLQISKQDWLEKFLDNNKNKVVYFSINNTVPPVALDQNFLVEYFGTSDILTVSKASNYTIDMFQILL